MMTNFFRSIILSSTAIIVTLAAAFAHAGQVRETLTASDTRGEFSFMSVDAQTSVRDLKAGKPLKADTELSGVLSFPGFLPTSASATNKVPAVVLMHGSNGPNKSVKAWADHLNGIGVATFMLDIFTGRGIKNSGEDQSQIKRDTGAIDALQALKLLASHPFIDSKRIAVMGFSKGGTSAEVAAFKLTNELVLGKDSPVQFAGHIAFYGGCYATARTTGAPILMLIGEAEDYLPAANCRHTVALLKMGGANVKLVTYPGAYHGFDTGNKLVRHPNLQNTPSCKAVADYDTGQFYLPNGADPMKGVPAAEMLRQRCESERGAHAGGNDAAAQAAKDEVNSFVKSYLQR